MGKLRVDILDGVDLPSADRNGKSDPYCKFELNGEEVFKTKVVKKTLAPVWNESFEIDVPSRTAGKFNVNVYDYDFADKPDFLGAADINLDQLEPFKASESTYMLDGKSGRVRVRMLFRPDYVTRAMRGTSTMTGTFGAPTRIVTGVAGVPIKGGVAVAGAVGHGVGRGASFLKRGILGKKEKENGVVAEVPEVPTVVAPVDGSPSGDPRRAIGLSDSQGHDGPVTPSQMESPSHGRTRSIAASSIHSAAPGGAPKGTATVVVVGASGFPASTDLFVVVSLLTPKEKVIGKTKHHKSSGGQWSFDETYKTSCSPDAQFKIEVKGDHFIGSSDSLGEHVYFVDDSGSGAPKELSIGEGTVTVKSSFQGAAESDPFDTPKSHLRRSFLSKRDPRSSRESTPNP